MSLKFMKLRTPMQLSQWSHNIEITPKIPYNDNMKTIITDIDDFIHMSHHWLDNRLAPKPLQAKLTLEERAFKVHQSNLTHGNKAQLLLIHNASTQLITKLMASHQLHEINDVLDDFVVVNQMIDNL